MNTATAATPDDEPEDETEATCDLCESATAAEENHRLWFEQLRGFLVERHGIFGASKGAVYEIPEPVARDLGGPVAEAERRAVRAAYDAIEAMATHVAGRFGGPAPDLMDILRPGRN